MNSSGYFILGGLLSGAGKGITDEYDRKRQDALLALQRSYQVEDRDARIAGDQSVAKINKQGQIDAIHATGAENRLTEGTRGEQDRETAKIKATVDLSHDKAIEAVKHEYNLSEITARSLADTQHDLKVAHITPDHYEIGANGQIVIWKKDGTAFVRGRDGDFVPKGSSDDDGGASITGEQSNRGGGKPAPAASADEPKSSPTAAQDQVRKQALIRLPGLYSQIQQDPAKFKTQYPGMFDANGNLLPIDELKNRINERYAG